MVRSHQRPLIMQLEERENRYTPEQQFLGEMRDTLTAVYSFEEKDGMRGSADIYRIKATEAVDMIATYFDLYVPKHHQKLFELIGHKSDPLEMRRLAVIVQMTMNEIEEKIKDNNFVPKGHFNCKIFDSDRLVVEDTINILEQYFINQDTSVDSK